MKRIVILLVCACLFVGCSNSESDASYPSGDYPESPSMTLADVVWPSSPGVSVLSDGQTALVDYSNASSGYVSARLLSSTSSRVKFQISKDDMKYNYDLTSTDVTYFPLQMGNGTYMLKLLVQISGTQYAIAASTEINVQLSDEFVPYLVPNQVVNYNAESKVTSLSFDIVSDDSDDLSRVYHLFNYVVDALSYDKSKAKNVSDVYVLPDIDASLAAGSGICFDYASTLAAMCRLQNIPAKVIVGWTDIEYHAWCEIYLEGEGWINPKVYFKGTSWSLLDPTFASSQQDYEGRYEEVYHY